MEHTLDLSDLSGVDPKQSYKVDLFGGEDAMWYELCARSPACLIPLRIDLSELLASLALCVNPWELQETDRKVPIYSILDLECPVNEDANWYILGMRGPVWLARCRRWLWWPILLLSNWVHPWHLEQTDEKVPVYDIRDWCAEHPVAERAHRCPMTESS